MWAVSNSQIEGAAYHEGGGRSNWDMMAQSPGKVVNGDSDDIAWDHYNRYRKDVRLMTDIGPQACRFSVNWPRGMPDRTGEVNPKRLDFNNRLVDELLEKDITPWLILFHWTTSTNSIVGVVS